MNNSKKLFVIYSLVILLFLSFESCKREDTNDIIQPVMCSSSSINGKCENEEEMCYKGTCISKDAKCGEIDAPCEARYDICVEDTENNTFKCTEGRCSRNNTDGTCKDETQICTSSGVCDFKCSNLYKEGACSSIENVCLEGACVDKKLLCSNEATEGLCKSGKICSANDTTQNFECVNACSELFPTGACSGDKKCFFNECRSEEGICSATNKTGVCAVGKICDEGICKRECSETVPNGVCFNAQLCVNGKCSFRCSETRPTGICDDETSKCTNGECKHKCSSTVLDGYCENSNSICIDGYCKEECSSENTDGVCMDREKLCDNGVCEYKCSFDNVFGVCKDEGKACLDGLCIERCSEQYPTGSCPERFKCEENECKEIECSELNLIGPCPEQGKQCLNGICLAECGLTQPNGWCSEENFICHNSVCVNSLEQDCSYIFKNGKCSLGDEVCVEGTCLKKECSAQYPDGRCENNKICKNGQCEDFSCSDGRPIYSAGTPNERNGGISGACCQINEDCQDGFESFGNFPTNFCIEDKVAEGPYCLGLQLTPNNDPFICGFTGGCNGCTQDADCTDPYPNNGIEEEYFCAMLTYYDFEIQGFGKKDIQLSYCQRLFNNCERKYKMQGEACDDRCKDSECNTALHCVKGTCTEQCENDSFCNNTLTCIPVTYDLPSTDKSVSIDVCAQECNHDQDCDVLSGNHVCSSFTNQNQVAPGETPAKVITYCYEENANKSPNGTQCNLGTDCKSDLCGEEAVCTSTCIEDSNCGTNAFCSYNALKTGEKVYSVNDFEEVNLNYLGECRYLSSVQNTVQTCTGKSDCPTETLNGKEYQCLPKFDLKRDVAEGKSGDAVYGRCGILKESPVAAYSANGDICNNTNQLCESDLCVCGDKLCEGNQVGVCLPYCEKSSDCNSDQYCKQILLREGVTYNREVYGGICETRDEGIDIVTCNTSNSSFDTLCPDNKTCIYNAVNSKPDLNNPNKLDVEYICVKEHTNKTPLNLACTDDSECNSQLCNKTTHKCSHACTNSLQCGDVNNVCNPTNVLIQDDNPTFTVYSGICE